MARDSQAALVALNRFGFGARGGASGDFINAASDPRGFVKAELSRPNGALLSIVLAVMAMTPRDGWAPTIRRLLFAGAPGYGMLLFSAFIYRMTGNPFTWTAQNIVLPCNPQWAKSNCRSLAVHVAAEP